MADLLNRQLYKIELWILKFIPYILAILQFTNTIFVNFGMAIPFLSYMTCVSPIVLLFLYISSYAFKFCEYHRIPLHYITIGNVIGLFNQWFQYPISSMNMVRVYFVLTGIAICIYIWFMYKNRNNPKIDPIKQLCDNYCRCWKINPA